MGWYGSGGFGAGWLLMIIVWVGLVGGLVWLLVRLIPGASAPSQPRQSESAQQILDRRLAMGEIDATTYASLCAALTAAKSDSSREVG